MMIVSINFSTIDFFGTEYIYLRGNVYTKTKWNILVHYFYLCMQFGAETEIYTTGKYIIEK